MGTNYYMTLDACQHCGRGSDNLHIGKSSAGWCFALNTHPEHGISSLDDWQAAWVDRPITDEYGGSLAPEQMVAIIVDRSGRSSRSDRHPFGYDSWEQFDEQNYAAPGPNGLSRHRIDGHHCLAHGEGTWDLLAGDFS